MAEQDLKQVMLDAIVDADSLEQFINGSVSETVLTRLNAKYPTLKRAIKQMFENGGLPATPFVTKAAMESSSLPVGSYAMVTNDVSDSINGLYLKSSMGWYKTKIDAKGVAESVILNSSLSDSTVSLPVFGAVEQGVIATDTGHYRDPFDGNYLTRVRLKKPMKTSSNTPVLVEVPAPNELLFIFYDNEMNKVSSSDMWHPSYYKVTHDGYVAFLIRKSPDDDPITPDEAVFNISKAPVSPPIMSDAAFGYVDGGTLVPQSAWEPGRMDRFSGENHPDDHLYTMRVRTRNMCRYSGTIRVSVREGWACRIMQYDKNEVYTGHVGYFNEDRLFEVDGFFKLVVKYIGLEGSVSEDELEFDVSGGIPIFAEPAKVEQMLPNSDNLLNKKEMRLRWVRGAINALTGVDRPLDYPNSKVSLNTLKEIPTSSTYQYTLRSDENSEFTVYSYGEDGEFLGTNEVFVKELTLSHDGYIRVVGRLRNQKKMPGLDEVGVYLSIRPTEKSLESKANSFLLSNFYEVYRANAVTPVSPGSTKDLAELSYLDIYAEYDAMVSAQPDYVKKELLGTDEAGIEYYKYVFSGFDVPMSLGSSSKPKKPKIVITGGVHGNEKNSTWSTLEFFKDLVNNERGDNSLDILKNSVEIQVFPMVNPKGWAANVRGNTIISDINRDFIDFESDEAKLIKGFLDSNSDAVAHIDMHNKGDASGSFYYTNSDQVINIAGSVFSSLISAWSKDYNISYEQEAQIDRVYRTNIEESIRGYASSGAGIENSITIEHPLLKVYFDSTNHGEATIKTSVDVLANTIIAIVKNNTN